MTDGIRNAEGTLSRIGVALSLALLLAVIVLFATALRRAHATGDPPALPFPATSERGSCGGNHA